MLSPEQRENDSPVDVHRHLLPLVVMFIFVLTLCTAPPYKNGLNTRRLDSTHPFPSLPYNTRLCTKAASESSTHHALVERSYDCCASAKKEISFLLFACSFSAAAAASALLCTGFSIHCLHHQVTCSLYYRLRLGVIRCREAENEISFSSLIISRSSSSSFGLLFLSSF